MGSTKKPQTQQQSKQDSKEEGEESGEEDKAWNAAQKTSAAQKALDKERQIREEKMRLEAEAAKEKHMAINSVPSTKKSLLKKLVSKNSRNKKRKRSGRRLEKNKSQKSIVCNKPSTSNIKETSCENWNKIIMTKTWRVPVPVLTLASKHFLNKNKTHTLQLNMLEL